MEAGKHGNGRLVAVFGSAGVLPGSADWQIAYEVGRYLAQAGYRVLTGGYSGVMEAASQGAAEAGGHVIGGTVGMFEQRGLRPNEWVSEIVRFETLRERLFFLVDQPDAIVTLRGGVGTLSELSLVWSLQQVGELPSRPLVLVGPLWRRFVSMFAEQSPITPNDLRLLTLVDQPDEIAPALAAWWAAPPNVPLRLGDAPSGSE